MPTVLVTGAASGIGRATAVHFAAKGWQCLLVDRDGKALDALVSKLPGRHHALGIDLTDAAQVRSLGGAVISAGPIDAVVNNAGMSDSSGTPLADQSPAQQSSLALLNLDAPAAVVSAVDARLAPGARVVNVSSGAGLRAIPFRGYYSASKAGLIAQTRALARARPDLGVTVLCPGFVRTELVEGLIAAGRLDPRQAVAKTPLGRMADPAEMAEMIGFLASPGAKAISGEVVALCGGSSVYGGTRACEPATRAPLPMDLPTALSVEAAGVDAWQGLAGEGIGAGCADGSGPQASRGTGAGEGRSPAAGRYQAVIDASPLAAGGNPRDDRAAPDLVATVHEAAGRFASRHEADASLTLLLPPDEAGDLPWQRAGEGAAARMLVATLACELASRALRVNAIEVAPGLSAGELAPLLQFVAGACAQFFTGQTLQTHRAQSA
jgi:NAD(P)-dependent dehydrogenase (short-subunit alcohol dehydrogenase family)